MIFKKLLSIFLVVVLTIGVCHVVVFAAEDITTFTEGNFTYNLNENGNAILEKCDTTAEGKIVIPAMTDSGHEITEISEIAFENCNKITEIYLSENIEKIEKPYKKSYTAFSGCSNLVRFVVDDKNEAFFADRYGVLFNEDKTVMRAYPCAAEIEHYSVPDTVCEIYVNFKDCKYLKTITLPKSLDYKSESSFENCSVLTDIYYDGTESMWDNIEGDIWEIEDKNITLHFRKMSVFEWLDMVMINIAAAFGPFGYFPIVFAVYLMKIPGFIIDKISIWFESILY